MIWPHIYFFHGRTFSYSLLAAILDAQLTETNQIALCVLASHWCNNCPTEKADQLDTAFQNVSVLLNFKLNPLFSSSKVIDRKLDILETGDNFAIGNYFSGYKKYP